MSKEELIKKIAEWEIKVRKETCGKCRVRLRAELQTFKKQLEKLQ